MVVELRVATDSGLLNRFDNDLAGTLPSGADEDTKIEWELRVTQNRKERNTKNRNGAFRQEIQGICARSVSDEIEMTGRMLNLYFLYMTTRMM